MKRLIAVTCVLAAAAGAGSIKIISSFDPSFNPGGPWTLYAMSIEYDGQYLWTTVDGYFLKRLHPSGSIVATYAVGGIWSGGLGYDGTYLYTTNVHYSYHIHKFDPSRGAVVGSFPCPRATRGGGLAYGGGFLYYTDWEMGVLYKLKTSGSVVSSIRLGFDRPWGLAYVKNPGAPYILCGTRPGSMSEENGVVYAMTTTGSVLDWAMWPFIGNFRGPGGMAYDGEYLWAILNEGGALGNEALRLQYNTDIGVTPTSVGKVKALFR